MFPAVEGGGSTVEVVNVGQLEVLLPAVVSQCFLPEVQHCGSEVGLGH